MHVFNYNLEETYNHSQNYGIYGSYSVENKEQIWKGQKHELFLNNLQISSNETVLILGVGFGWFVEKMIEKNITRVCPVDTSTWIHENKNFNSSIEIYNFDVTDYSTHNSIKTILNLTASDKIDWCITEDFFTEITDDQCVNISNALKLLGNNVIHYITRMPPSFVFNDSKTLQRNWKSKEDWETLLSPDLIFIR